MPLIEDIKAVHERKDIDDNEKRKRLYQLKTGALIGAINGHLIGRSIERAGGSFRINSASVTPDHRLHLDVTFTRPPAEPVTHQINITNPPTLPRERTGNEKEDLLAAVSEMLEGFV